MSEESTRPRRIARRRRANAEGGRTHRHEVKLTTDEQTMLLAMAEARGITVPRLLFESTMAASTGQTLTERNELIAEVFRLQRAFGAVGTNVNQIAKVLNSTGEVSPELDATMAGIRALLPRVMSLSEKLSAE